jgi:3-(3-hydroxy-phenyl)propionate hydroxylase
MMSTYTYPRFPYVQSAAQREGRVERHPVVVIGAGPIGLTAALDCARRGLRVLLLDDNDTVSIGSRAVCYAKRPLEVWDRLGVAAPMVAKGVSWQVGKVFFRDELAYQFDLLPESQHQMPAMINLQQYHLEEMLIAALQREPNVTIAWKHRALSLQQAADHATLSVETPDGIYRLEADWVIACDGANSDTRRMVGAEFTGQFFQDRFLIADVVMKAEFPTERWFWFDPPFHPASRCCCTSRPTTSGASTSSSAGMPTPTRSAEARERGAAHPRDAGAGRRFELEWVASTVSAAGASTASAMAA